MHDKFDHSREDFDIKEISDFYRLKVSGKVTIDSLQHERTPVSLFMDRFFKGNLAKFAQNKQDYEQLYVKTKLLSHLANQQFLSNWEHLII